MRFFGSRGSKLQFPLKLEELQQKPRNDAADYGVIIHPIRVPEGAAYWRVLHVHHLSPEENRGERAIYIEVLDEEGRRVPNVSVRVRDLRGETVHTLDPNEKRPGLRLEMDEWSIYEVEVEGLPSEKVLGLSTTHPKEGKGNPENRHSFLVVWQRVTHTRPAVETPTAAPEGRGEGEAVREHEGPTSEPKRTSPVPEIAVIPEPALKTSSSGEAEAQEAPAKRPLQEILPPTPEPQAQIPKLSERIPRDTEVTAVEESEQKAEVATPIPPEEGAEARSPEESVPPPGEVEAKALEEKKPEVAPPLSTFVLFTDGQEDAELGAFFVAMGHIREAGISFGFDAWEVAQHAQRVIIIGPASAEQVEALEARGVEVIRISAESPTLVHDLEHALGVG